MWCPERVIRRFEMKMKLTLALALGASLLGTAAFAAGAAVGDEVAELT